MNENVIEMGRGWLVNIVRAFIEETFSVKPSIFSERHRYLPESVSPMPGPMRWDINPFMREIVDCFDVDSPIREVNLKKGVQITYTTLLESGILYFMAHVKTLPLMYITADQELAAARIDGNIIPMINHSGFAHIVRSSDATSTRKTGKTKSHIQWEGGGYLIPGGAINANKMRQHSIAVMLKDEIDAWPETVGKDGDPDALTDARCAAYFEQRKIFRGSTPLIKGISKIEKQYLRGDQRKYLVCCLACGFAQELRWSGRNEITRKDFGMKWELDSDGMLVIDAVRYVCANCGHEHFECDKEVLFATDHGAHWEPTARAVEPFIRSYHLPAMYSPLGMQPWYKCVSLYLEAFDPINKKARDIGKLRVFYNNILAEPFEEVGEKILFIAVSAHRRSCYRLGSIPNQYAKQYSGGPILFLTCQVDLHKNNLAVAIIGWTIDARSYLIDYWRLEDDSENGCESLGSPVWVQLRKIIEEKKYKADDGVEYGILFTLVDAGHANDTVSTFCAEYEAGVYPILGRSRTARNQRISEFAEFKTQVGGVGYRILVDHYKDRLAPVLRREWMEESGLQERYHFNAPIDLPDKALKELTVERKREVRNEKGEISYEWYRPGNSPNELWDLLNYGHAAIDILAWSICVKYYQLETVDWPRFWDHFIGR